MALQRQRWAKIHRHARPHGTRRRWEEVDAAPVGGRRFPPVNAIGQVFHVEPPQRGLARQLDLVAHAGIQLPRAGQLHAAIGGGRLAGFRSRVR